MKSDQRLADAAAALVASRVKKAKKQIRAAAKGDVDGVHDLRVAVRKLRAAISVLRETILGTNALEREDRALRDLFAALGDARDDDVMLERITTMAKRRRLSAKTIAKLTSDLAAEQKHARKRVRRLIEKHPPKKLFARIAKKIHAHGAKPVVLAGGVDVPPMLVRHFLASVLFARWERVIAYETTLPAPYPTLHRLRVAIKKLRYAVDFFAGALDGAAKLDQPLQLAQDILGDLHDHDVARNYVLAHGGNEDVIAEEHKDAAKLFQRFEAAWDAISGAGFAAQLARSIGAAYQHH